MAKGRKTGSIIAPKQQQFDGKSYEPIELQAGDVLHYMNHDLAIGEVTTETRDGVTFVTFSFDNHEPIVRRSKARVLATLNRS